MYIIYLYNANKLYQCLYNLYKFRMKSIKKNSHQKNNKYIKKH